jgi:hypothetical protein
LALAPGTGTAFAHGTTASPRAFTTPSKNIVCAAGSALGDGYVDCILLSGLRPRPPVHLCRAGDPGDWLELEATGKPSLARCHGDPGPFLGVMNGDGRAYRAGVLEYGRTWRYHGVRCDSARIGLTCRNRSGHGFFLSRERWRLF